MKTPTTRRWCGCAGTVVAVWLATPILAADAPRQDLPAAADFLQSATPPMPGASPSGAPTLQSVVLGRAKELSAQKASLPPKDAATKWIALAILIPELLGDDSRGEREMLAAATAIRDALPPPPAGPELDAALAAAPATADPRKKAWRDHLHLLIAILNNDRPTLEKAAAALAKTPASVAGGPPLSYSPVDYRSDMGSSPLVTELQKYLLDTTDDPAAFKEQIRTVLTNREGRSAFDYGWYSGTDPTSMDLAELLGKDEADKLLTPLIVSGRITEVANPQNLALANEIALREISRLSEAPWALAAWEGGGPLFDALIKRFGYVSANSRGRDDPMDFEAAVKAKLTSLVGTGNIDEAFALVEAVRAKMPSFDPHWNETGADALSSPVSAKLMADHLLALARAAPTSAWWTQGLPFAEAAGDGDLWLTNLDQARQKASGTDAVALARVYRLALLDLGHEDQALALWRQAVADAAAQGVTTSGDRYANDDKFRDAVELAASARLLHKTDLENEALGFAAKLTGSNGYSKRTLAKMDFEAGRLIEAANLVADAQRTDLAEYMTQQADRHEDPLAIANFDCYFPEMAEIYAKAGRWADVRALLEQGQWWKADDLRDVLTDSAFFTPLGVIAAEAFFRTGQAADAHRILDAFFARDLGEDRAYELLLAMDGDQAFAKLEALAQLNPFQARPYIWEGVILLRQGKATEAEKVLRQAIAIDPSDGESRHGDRMRAYDVLAQALDAQGRTEDAKVYHHAIQAIRLAESADDYFNSGLTARGLQMYRDALGIFTDAYCIQSRLAKDLYGEGRFAEAAEHYQRAFELMPASFGRMESHCFGCEGVFAGPLAVSIAEKVFTTSVRTHPELPQAHYLLGMFYDNVGRHAEAADSFAQAVKLDPLYINAWSHLQENLRQLPAHGARANEAALALARLTPGGLNYDADADEVTDLAALWKIVAEKTAGNDALQSASVLPLPATSRRRAAHPVPNDEYESDNSPATPERIIFGQSLIRDLWSEY